MLPVWCKRFFIVVALCGLVIASPPAAFAIVGIDEPLIPCGTNIQNTPEGSVITNPCGVCHVFALIQNIYNFLIFVITPPVAIVMLGIAGFYWLTAGGNPGRFQKGIQIIKTTIIGLVMMYAAWLVVSFAINLIANKVGVAYNPAVWYNPSEWFVAQCKVRTP